MASFIETFFDEKDLEEQTWEVEDKQGRTHIIGTEIVVDFLKKNPALAKQAEPTLRKIDFANGDVNHFLKHIAGFIADHS